MSVFFRTGCRVSAVTGACVGHLETDGVEHDLHVTEKRNHKRRKILLDAARPVLAYVQRAGIEDDREGPLFRPLTPDATRLIRRHWTARPPGGYSRTTGRRPGSIRRGWAAARGIGIHSLRKTAINDAIRNGATMHEVREFAGHADILKSIRFYATFRLALKIIWVSDCAPKDSGLIARRAAGQIRGWRTP